MSRPLFTQKHYEYLSAAISAADASEYERDIVARILSDVFKQNNPMFKSELFYQQIGARRRRPARQGELL